MGSGKISETPKKIGDSNVGIANAGSMSLPTFPFYFGTFISSLGSQTFSIGLIAFMKAAGYSLWRIGFVIGAMQAANIFVTLLWGETADRLPPKKVVIWTELASILIAPLLAWSWAKGPDYFSWLLFAAVLRASILAVQAPGKNKIAKILSKHDSGSNAKRAIWLNKVSYGAIFFAAGLSWLAINFSQFLYVILFDAITFFINGLILLFCLQVPPNATSTGTRILKKFSDLYRYCGRFALADLLLTVALCGGNVFIVRFAGEKEEWIPIYLASYGLAIWTTGFLQRIKWVQRQHALFWVGLAASFFLLANHPGEGVVTLLCLLISDHFYWLLYHKYSAQIQVDTPLEHMAAVSSARTVQMLAVIAIGEFAVGAWSGEVSVYWEAIWRGLFSLIVALFIRLT